MNALERMLAPDHVRGDDVEPKSEVELIDWLTFCDKESTRYALDAPWVKSGWKFATDSRVMIAVPTGEPDSPPNEKGRKYVNALPLLQPILGREIEWQPLPRFERHEPCDNKGKITKACHRCRGLKEAECDMGHWHRCDECDEEGNEHEICECFVRLGGRNLATEHFEKVAALPNVRWHTPDDNPESAVFFVFGELSNCFAVVMPLSQDVSIEGDWTERKAVTA